MRNLVVLLGKPGAGKGTRLSELMATRGDDFEVIAVSNLLRKVRNDGSKIGKKIKSFMEAGELVPDEIVNNLVFDAIRASEKTVITDGFPRTVGQAQAMLDSGLFPTMLICFDIDDEEVVKRAEKRLACGHCGETYTTDGFKPPKMHGICDKCGHELSRRADDEEHVVRKRLEDYQNKTLPVMSVLMKAGVEVMSIDCMKEGNVSACFAGIMEDL